MTRLSSRQAVFEGFRETPKLLLKNLGIRHAKNLPIDMLYWRSRRRPKENLKIICVFPVLRSNEIATCNG